MKRMMRVLVNLLLLIVTIAAAAIGAFIFHAVWIGVDVHPVFRILLIECVFIAGLGTIYFIEELTR